MLKKFAVALLTLILASLPLAGIAKADTAATNLITNPSFETSTAGTTPDNWQASNYSTVANGNTATFSYLNAGHSGTHSAEVQVTKFTDGSANWYYPDVAVTAGTTYQFSDWYQASIDTEVDAEVMVNGVAQYFKVGTAFASPTWKSYTGTFTVPAGGTAMSVYHLIAGVGTLTTDDYSLTTYTPAPFNRAMVSVTFDDGWLNQYQNGVPVMTTDGLVGTYYIISDSSVTNPDPLYMNGSQIKSLYAAGNEIASHSVTHPDLTTLTPAQLTTEMQQSQTVLQNLIGAPVTDFAYPFGTYNAATIAEGLKYYQSQRTVNAGFNTKDSLDATQLKMYEVDSNITTAQVQAWIDEAIATKSWLILTYHEIATTPSDPTDAQYTTQPADFATEMAYLKSTGVNVETVAQALADAKAQLKPGDLNNDGSVDALDLSTLLTNWNKTGVTAAKGDLNGDATVDALDLSALLTNWSK
ncbi:MAG TPA: polysaccharide deacetylase family protein [Candidatus Saccharimonadales bacterium]|nr:polysaccharide deacetylase family protein [Candidatus Saccharimonadales bacterium]